MMLCKNRKYERLLAFALMCLLTSVCPLRSEGVFDKLRQILDGDFDNEDERSTAMTKNRKILYSFFDDAFTPGGFVYEYPEASKVSITEEVAKNGEVSLQFDLVPTEYSGGALCLYNGTYDLRSARKNGACLKFWIKGAKGNEKMLAALVDEAKSDDKKTVVRLRVDWYGCDSISTEWTSATIPLQEFPERGFYWDDKDSIEIKEQFNWSKVAEFRIEIRKNENKSFRVWVDDIFIVGRQ
ncbi:MAG: hypothetical protein JW913_08165 [Chitinispirillaceae bacterium]|nr:hypothetical protein [Chitinispirillaceae bacterium]